MTVKDVDLIKVLPRFLAEDESSRAVCRALEPLIRQVAEKMDLLNFYTDPQKQPDRVLDQLAVGWGVSWYNGEDDIDAKKRIISDALKVFGRLGTVSSLTDALVANFGAARVEEWFGYDGDPCHFRIMVEDPSATGDRIERFLQMMKETMALHAKLDEVVLMKSSSAPDLIGCIGTVSRQVRSVVING